MSLDYDVRGDEATKRHASFLTSVHQNYPHLGWDRLADAPGGLAEAANQSASMRALFDIVDLCEDDAISDLVQMRAMRLVMYVFSEHSIFASVAPDGEGGLVFYWAAGKRTIEIDVLEPDEFYWRVTNEQGEVVLRDEGPELDVIELTHALKIFSKEVDQINPDWAKLYARS